MRIHFLLVSAFLLYISGCTAFVDVTKTAKGYHDPTNPNEIEILTMAPKRPFIELATISSGGWDRHDTAKLYNAFRAKSAPIGANAVVIHNMTVNPETYLLSSFGSAIKWKNSSR